MPTRDPQAPRGWFWLVLLPVLMISPTSSWADRHALLIGVSRYKEPAYTTLDGAVYDTLRMRRVLIRELMFPEENVTILLDVDATRQKIVAALQNLANVVQPGDVVLIQYNAHGAWRYDEDGDETEAAPGDTLDEVLVTYDTDADLSNSLLDDEFGKWLNQIKASEIVVIVDACYSGTATKSIGGNRSIVRSLSQPKPEGASVKAVFPDGVANRASLSQDILKDVPHPGSRGAQQKRIVVSACRADQKAYELQLPHVMAGFRAGALSWYLTEGLRSSATLNPAGQVTYGALYDYVVRRMDEDINLAQTDSARRQTPQIEYSHNDLAEEPFCSVERKRPPFTRVTFLDPQRVRLDSGAVHGVVAGQTLGLFASAEQITDRQQCLGRIRVTAVDLKAAVGVVDLAPPMTTNLVAAPLTNPVGAFDILLLSELIKAEASESNQLAHRVKDALDLMLRNEFDVRSGVDTGYDLRLSFHQRRTSAPGIDELLVEIRDGSDAVAETFRRRLESPLLDGEAQQIASELAQRVNRYIATLRTRRMWSRLINPHAPFGLQLVTHRSVPETKSVVEFRRGEPIKLALKSTADVWYWLVCITPQGRAEPWSEAPLKAPAGAGILFPRRGKTMTFDGQSGVYLVKLLATRQKPPERMPIDDPESVLAWLKRIGPEDWSSTSLSLALSP